MSQLSLKKLTETGPTDRSDIGESVRAVSGQLIFQLELGTNQKFVKLQITVFIVEITFKKKLIDRFRRSIVAIEGFGNLLGLF